MSDSLQPHELYSQWNSPGQNTGVGSLSFLQGIFPTQGWNPRLLYCRRILYELSYEETTWARNADDKNHKIDWLSNQCKGKFCVVFVWNSESFQLWKIIFSNIFQPQSSRNSTMIDLNTVLQKYLKIFSYVKRFMESCWELRTVGPAKGISLRKVHGKWTKWRIWLNLKKSTIPMRKELWFKRAGRPGACMLSLREIPRSYHMTLIVTFLWPEHSSWPYLATGKFGQHRLYFEAK